MDAISVGLYVFAYLSAVIDGIVQDKGLYPSDSGRTGFRLFAREHCVDPRRSDRRCRGDSD